MRRKVKGWQEMAQNCPLQWARRLVVVSIAALLSLAMLAPHLAALGYPESYQVFHSLCHQIGERCFYIGGLPMAICVRCTGIYAGIAVGTLLITRCEKWQPYRLAGLCVAVALLGMDVGAESLGIYHNVKWWRLVVGGVLGLVLSLFLSCALTELFAERVAQSSPSREK